MLHDHTRHWCWIACAWMEIASSAMAGDRYVWRDAPSSGFPFESWEKAATNIHDAFAAALADETLWITNGDYPLTNTITIDTAIVVKSVNGRDQTTLYRPGTASQFRLFIISNAGASVEGFTLTNGYARAVTIGGDGMGGAIRIYDGSVRDCLVAMNQAQGDVEGGTSNVHGRGGGIYMSGGRVEDCYILDNTALGNGSGNGYGGGVFASTGAIIRCTIAGNNRALGSGNGSAYGGGIYLAGTAQLRDSAILGNFTLPAGNSANNSHGGGLYMYNAGVGVTNCLIASNKTDSSGNNSGNDRWGGGVYMVNGTLDRCVIASNIVTATQSSKGAGGGLYLMNGMVRNCLFHRNMCMADATNAPGGGVRMQGGRVENCTVVSNYAAGCLTSDNTNDTTLGGGINRTGGAVTNTIVVLNQIRNPDVSAAVQISGTNRFGYCCSPDLENGSDGNITAAPIFIKPWEADFRLRKNSAGIDQGIKLPWMTEALDLVGAKRIQAGLVDMGAYELTPQKGIVMGIR